MDWLFHQLLIFMLHLLLFGHFRGVICDNNNTQRTSTLLPDKQYSLNDDYRLRDVANSDLEKKSSEMEMTTTKMNSVPENTAIIATNHDQPSADSLVSYFREKYSMENNNQSTSPTSSIAHEANDKQIYESERIISDNVNNNNTPTLPPDNQFSLVHDHFKDFIQSEPEEKRESEMEMTTAKYGQQSVDSLISYLRKKYSMGNDNTSTTSSTSNVQEMNGSQNYKSGEIIPDNLNNNRYENRYFYPSRTTIQELLELMERQRLHREMLAKQWFVFKKRPKSYIEEDLPTKTEASIKIADHNQNPSTSSINQMSINNEAFYSSIALPQKQLPLFNKTDKSNISDHESLQIKMDAINVMDDAIMRKDTNSEERNHNNVIHWPSKQEEPLTYVAEPLSNNDTINGNNSVDGINKQQISTTTESAAIQEPVHDSNEITAHASFPGFHFPFDSLWQITDTTVPTAMGINHFSTAPAPVPVSAVIPVVPKSMPNIMPTAEATTTTETYFLPTIIQNMAVNAKQQQQEILSKNNNQNKTISPTDKNISNNNLTTNTINVITTTTGPLPSTFLAIRSTSAPLSYNNPDKKAKQIPVVLLQGPLTVSTSGPILSQNGLLPTRNHQAAIHHQLQKQQQQQQQNSRQRDNNNNNNDEIINSDKRRIMTLLPRDQLRNYIEDAYIRIPLAVIVDPTASNQLLERTKPLWNDALQTNINIQIVLLTLNALGKLSFKYITNIYYYRVPKTPL